MLIIGNKPYYNLKLTNLLDNFDKNIRLNFGLPNYNNGSLTYIQYLNTHVYKNLKLNNLQQYKTSTNTDEEYLNKFIDIFKQKDFKFILEQNNNYYIIYNRFLNDNGCPYLFTKLPRLGCNAIFDTLLNLNGLRVDKDNIYISNFSTSINENNLHLYNNRDINDIGKCHNVNDEIFIINWLHNNNYIDATFCYLYDYELPFINCKSISPTLDVVSILLKEYGICVLEDYYTEEQLNSINREFDNIFINNKNKIEILDKEECSNDERIFHAERYSKIIKEYFSDNKFLNDCAMLYNKRLNKKTLINKIEYEDNKIKNSGAGWHRDNHDCQFKAIMYLTDVTENNGNFQFLTNSSKKFIGYPKPRTENYNTRFYDNVIQQLIENNDNVKLHDIIGKKGTIILADTTYIHRGNIIKEGSRKAITQYFF